MTFGGHPVQCAIALKNIEIMKRERVVENVAREWRGVSASTLAQLLELDIVGDLRGTGFFYALELVKDKETREGFSDEECETLLRGFLSPRLFERGLICRADDRGDPVIQISPPLSHAGGVRRDHGHPRRRARRGAGAHARAPPAGERGSPRARYPPSVRVLVVGTGGVGSAVAPIAARRRFFERIVFADLDASRPLALVERLGDARFGAAQRRRVGRGRDRRARARRALRRDPQRDRPALQPVDLPGGVRRRLYLPRPGDDALEARRASASATCSSPRHEAWRGARPARARRHRRRAWPLGRVRPLRRRPSLLRDRRGGRARRRRPRRRGLRRSRRRSRSGRRSRSASTRRSSGRGTAAGTRPSRSRSRRCSTSRKGSARSSA